MALNPINPIQSGSATATNGSPTITVTGGVDCSFIVPGFILQLGTRRIVTAISGTAPVSGTSTITLAANWDQPTTTDVLIGWNSYESLPNIVNRIQNALGQQTAIGELTTNGLIEKTSTNAYQTVTITAFGKSLIDDADAAAARTTLGAQASDVTLTAMAGVTTAANKIIYFTGVDAAASADLSAYGRTLIATADAAAARIALSAQAADATLNAMAGITTAANKFIYFTGVDAAAAADLSAFGRSVIAGADAAAVNALLGVQSKATVDLVAQLFQRATLDLNFATNRHNVYGAFGPELTSLTTAITTARNSTAAYQSPTSIVTAAINAPRITYNAATGDALGLLAEEQRTRLNTASASVTAPQNATVTAATHTIGFYGTGSVVLSGAHSATLVGTGSGRVTLTFTPTAGTLTMTPSGTVTDLQLELGVAATSIIRGNEGAQVTRFADVISRALTTTNANAGSIFIEFDLTSYDKASGNAATVVKLSDAANTGLRGFGLQVFNNDVSVRLRNATFSYNASLTVADSLQPMRALISYDNLTLKLLVCVNGVSAETNMPTAVDMTGFIESLILHSASAISGGTAAFSKTVKRCTYIPRGMTAAEAQAITA